jgi:hypothetical protein
MNVNLADEARAVMLDSLFASSDSLIGDKSVPHNNFSDIGP